jgi:hypothetical protein
MKRIIFVVIYRESQYSGWQVSDSEWYSINNARAEMQTRLKDDGIYAAQVMTYDEDNPYSFLTPTNAFQHMDSNDGEFEQREAYLKRLKADVSLEDLELEGK